MGLSKGEETRLGALPTLAWLVPGILVLSALILLLTGDPGREWLRFDRSGIAAGEFWRLLTGHLVHFSPSHAGWDLAVFALAGGWLERRDRAAYLGLIALAAAASGIWFLAVLPDMARYGGLSGLASASAVLLALHGIHGERRVRPLWAAVPLLFAAKVCYELVTGAAAFAVPGATRFEVVPSVHVIGALAAILLFRAHRRRKPLAAT